MSESLIWMPLYWSDWMRDTARLSLQEQGAYFMLLKEYWNNGGPLTNDKTRIYRATGAQSRSEKESVNLILETYFLHENGMYRHARIDAELAEAAENKDIQRKRTEAARAARAKRTETVTENVTDTVTASPSPSPSPSTNVDIGSDTNVSGESGASPPVIDFKKIIFDDGLKWLADRTDKDPDKLRSLLGKWCKHGADRVAAALIRAQEQSAVDPISFIEASLRGDTRGNNPKPSARRSRFGEQDYTAGTEGFDVI